MVHFTAESIGRQENRGNKKPRGIRVSERGRLRPSGETCFVEDNRE